MFCFSLISDPHILYPLASVAPHLPWRELGRKAPQARMVWSPRSRPSSSPPPDPCQPWQPWSSGSRPSSFLILTWSRPKSSSLDLHQRWRIFEHQGKPRKWKWKWKWEFRSSISERESSRKSQCYKYHHLCTHFSQVEKLRERVFCWSLRPQEERGIDNFYMSLSNWNDNAIQQLKRSHRIEQCMKWSSQAIGSYLHATSRVAVRFCSSRTLWDTNRAILGLTVLGPDWSISLSGPIFLLATLHVHFSVFNKFQKSIGPKRLVLIDQFLCPILSFSSPILHII